MRAPRGDSSADEASVEVQALQHTKKGRLGVLSRPKDVVAGPGLRDPARARNTYTVGRTPAAGESVARAGGK